jgi:hypothetical protein
MNGSVRGTNIYIKYQRRRKIKLCNLSCRYTQGTTACKHAPSPLGVRKTYAALQRQRLQFAFSGFYTLYVENCVTDIIISCFVVFVTMFKYKIFGSKGL